MERLDLLSARFGEAGREFSRCEERAQAQIRRWQWASGPLYRLKPFEYQRSGHTPGRWRKGPPDPEKVGPAGQPCEYGLDAEGRPVLERMHFWGSEGLYERRFFFRETNYWEELHFDAQRKWPSLVYLCRLEVENGRPLSAAWYSAHQKGFEDYSYNGERLERVAGSWSNAPFGTRRLLTAHWELEYDGEGQPTLIRIIYEPTAGHPGGSYTAFKRRRK